jgi:ATP-dependent 26S proteasome regulatory subunit
LEIAVPVGSQGNELARGYLQSLREAVERSASYRGKVLSLERQQEYAGGLQHDIKVHRLAPVSRTEIILPGHTLKLLERNVFQFLEHRDRLLELNMAVKKGLLLYGPPGTGKTHTIRYLAGALSDHTTLLVTAEEVAFIAEYMALARLLSPSIVVIEDVDLIARDREELQTPIQEALLNRLLNEMDGLRENSEVLFILTTNRPESLEAALASRPGRIDQAIEFPLPDDAARHQLIDLYRRDLEVPGALIRNAVERTEGVSAAFIKELMRRTAQMMAERDGSATTATPPDLDAALNEMLFEGGSLNAKLLGAAVSDGTPRA